MSDKNIDKDKQIIQYNIYDDREKKVHYIDISGEDCYEFLDAIENVLSELEKKELEIKVKTSNLALLTGNNNKLKEELETYKKIAEKLVDKILEMDIDGEVYDFFCKYIPMEKCDEIEEGRCDKCIIDWARKEVEKDG